MKIKCFRKGARVRYIGNDPDRLKAWGQSVQIVNRKSGDSVVGCFPAVWYDGVVRSIEYAVKISDLELVF